MQAYPDRELAADQELHAVTWNLGKRVKGPVLSQLEGLCTSEHTSLVALQECRMSLPVPSNYGGHFGRSFRLSPKGDGHGVGTLCTAEPAEASVLQARHRELRIATPKVALATVYPVSDGRLLLCLNVHALNFDRAGRRFAQQIEDLGQRLQGHDGPVLFCGDFNTWRPERLGALHQVAGDLGLDEVLAGTGDGRTGGATPLGNKLFGIDPSLELDRMFFRGLTLLESRWLVDLTASDHTPLHARFAF